MFAIKEVLLSEFFAFETQEFFKHHLTDKSGILASGISELRLCKNLTCHPRFKLY